MRNKLIVILSLTLILVGGFCLGVFFRNKQNLSVVIYNPITNSTKTVEARNGENFLSFLSGENISGYDIAGYYFDNSFKNKIKETDIVTANTTVYAGYIQNTSDISFNPNVVGVKFCGELTSSVMQELAKFNYVDISSATGNINFEENNNYIEEIIIGDSDELSNINNFSKLKRVKLGEIQFISNCFNNCPNLSIIENLNCLEIEDSFNDSGEIEELNLNKNVIEISQSFQKTKIKKINSLSSKYSVSSGILYEKNGSNFKVVKAENVVGDVVLNQDTTDILPYAFYGQSKLRNVVAKEKLISVGEHAFEKSSIEKLDLSENLPPLEIGEYAFCDTVNLKSISLGRYVNKIKQKAFKNSGIENIDFSSNTLLSEIGEYAFENNVNLKKVVFPNSNITIKEGAFKDCLDLSEVKNLMTNSISKKCFYGCAKLENIVNLQSVVTIEDMAFYNCSSLANTNSFVDVVQVEKQAFANCSSLVDIYLPRLAVFKELAFANCPVIEFKSNQNISSADFSAFEGCENLSIMNIVSTNYVIENNVVYSSGKTKILFYAANNSAESFEVASTVTEIETKFLSMAKNIKEFSVSGGNFSVVDGVLYDATGSTMLCYPRAKTTTSFEVPSSVTKINSNCFYGTYNLRTLNINSNVQTIENGALVNIPAIETLNISFLGKSIDDTQTCFVGWIFGATTCFENDVCVPTSLKYVKVSDQSQFSEGAFYGCKDILEISALKMTEIKESMFFSCLKLRIVKVGKVQRISIYAFGKCKSLTRLYITYNEDIVVNSSAFIDMASSIKVYVDGITQPSELANYKAIFKKSNWDFIIV